MAGRKALKSIRVRLEAANGTRGTPRFLWRGNGESVSDDREITNPEEQIGVFGGSDRTYTAKLGGSIEFAETPATFEQLGDLFLGAGFGTIASGYQGSVQGGNGSAVMQYLAVPTTTALPTPSYTIEGGDNIESQVLIYSQVDELSLTFAGGEAMQVSAKWTGQYGTRTNAVGSFSAAGTLVKCETVLSGMGTFYLAPADTAAAAYGAAGGTVTQGNILAGEVTFTPAWSRKYSVDAGKTYFHTAVWTDIEIAGKLTLEHQVSGTVGAAGSAGQIEKWRAELPQLIRMQWPGGTIQNGTTYSAKLLQIDLPIKWSKFNPLDDMDGNNIVEGEFFSKYNEVNPAAGRGTVLIVRQGTSEFAGA